MALALALFPSLALWTPAAAHPLPAQGYFASFSGLAPQVRDTFGWRNLTCPVCKSLFTILDFGLQVSAVGAVGAVGKQARPRAPGPGSREHPHGERLASTSLP